MSAFAEANSMIEALQDRASYEDVSGHYSQALSELDYEWAIEVKKRLINISSLLSASSNTIVAEYGRIAGLLGASTTDVYNPIANLVRPPSSVSWTGPVTYASFSARATAEIAALRATVITVGGGAWWRYGYRYGFGISGSSSTTTISRIAHIRNHAGWSRKLKSP